jgi:hypothetical protein
MIVFRNEHFCDLPSAVVVKRGQNELAMRGIFVDLEVICFGERILPTPVQPPCNQCLLDFGRCSGLK